MRRESFCFSTAFMSFFWLLSLLAHLFLVAPGSINGCFTSIFSFGDSIADTGNLLISSNGNIPAAGPPYGRTYFHRPTGRYSDGRLIVDFIAEAFGLPHLRPFLAGPGDEGFGRGVNFAVAGATALDFDYFKEKSLSIPFTNLSLQVQFGWFKELLPSICSTDSECRNLLGTSLFLAGEIGGNDLNFGLMQRRSVTELKSYVPIVTQIIGLFINDLIKLGAKTILVPGNFPLGCNVAFLTAYQSSQNDYDLSTGCLNSLNELSQYYNKHLQLELDHLRALHPHATIIYADYYSPVLDILSCCNGTRRVPLAACCGAGGPYNVNLSVRCGDELSSVCNDPSSYAFWDEVHLTEAAYRTIATGLLEGPFAAPPLKEACPHTNLVTDYQVRKDIA